MYSLDKGKEYVIQPVAKTDIGKTYDSPLWEAIRLDKSIDINHGYICFKNHNFYYTNRS